MEIKQVKIEELKPADYNPRILSEKQYHELRRSLEEFGLVDPIIVNSNPDRFNIVIGGHQRLRVAKDIGYTEVPVYYVNLSEEQEKKLNLRLNKNVGEWDFDALANYFDSGMLFDVGFTEKDLSLGLPENFVANDVNEEWVGMPTVNETKVDGAVKSIYIHFQTEESIDEFSKLIGQEITDKTKFIWFPKKDKDNLKDIEIKAE